MFACLLSAKPCPLATVCFNPNLVPALRFFNLSCHIIQSGLISLMKVSPRQRRSKDSPPQPLQRDVFRKDGLKAVASFPAPLQEPAQPGSGTQHPISNSRPSRWAASHPEETHPKHPREHTENPAHWKRGPRGKAVAAGSRDELSGTAKR